MRAIAQNRVGGHRATFLAQTASTPQEMFLLYDKDYSGHLDENELKLFIREAAKAISKKSELIVDASLNSLLRSYAARIKRVEAEVKQFGLPRPNYKIPTISQMEEFSAKQMRPILLRKLLERCQNLVDNTGSVVSEAVRKMDTNKDGRIDMHEFQEQFMMSDGKHGLSVFLVCKVVFLFQFYLSYSYFYVCRFCLFCLFVCFACLFVCLLVS